MGSLPRYEGDFEQIHGNHLGGEPINRSHAAIQPTPEHKVDDIGYAALPDSHLTSYALAACVEPLGTMGGGQSVTGVRVEFL